MEGEEIQLSWGGKVQKRWEDLDGKGGWGGKVGMGRED